MLCSVAIILLLIGTLADSRGVLEIQPEGGQVTKLVGSSVALVCSSNVESPSLVRQLQWKNTRNRTIDITNPEALLYIQKLNGESAVTLIFSKLTENLAGTYTCTASYATTEQLAAMTKINTLVAITWIDAREAQYALLDTDYKIRCEVKDNPAPTVNWLKNGEDINDKSNDRYLVDSEGLWLKKVEESDDAVYTCTAVAFNAVEIQIQNIKVDVQIPPQIKPLKIVEVVEGVQTSTVCNGIGKPQIYELFNITYPVGSNAKIICKAKGRPAPKIIWRKFSNREPFRTGLQDFDPRIVQEYVPNEEKGETIGILSFDRLNRSDDGLYECIAENKVGTAYKNGHVTVQFAPTFDKTRDYSPVWTWNNRPANLTCMPEAIPNATIQWRYNGIYIDDSTSPNIHIFGLGPTSSLIVKPYNEPRLFTFYECIAINQFGTARHRMELREATVPTYIQQAKPETVTATTVKFGIFGPPNSRGLPLRSITVEYQTERERTWNNARKHTWSYNATYILENLVPEEVYNFRFAATNDVGVGPWGGDQQIKMPKRSVQL